MAIKKSGAKKSNVAGKSGELSPNVSTLKLKLGQYLRAVKSGREVIILDRNTPVAKIIPYSGEELKLTKIPPVRPMQDFEDLLKRNEKSSPAIKLSRSVLDYLKEERGDK